jgi:hypothetical protein
MADPESDIPPIDEPGGSFRFYPWPDLLKRPRREWIVDRLIPVRGVTTLVGQPGEGKTTLAMGLALSVATGTKFAGQQIKQRPVIMIFGEGQEDSRPLYEAWLKYQQASGKVAATVKPEGAFHDGPLNLFEAGDTDKLIAILKDFPREWPAPLIGLDALADMMDGGDEDRAKDMNRVYGNVWRVVRETGASFLVIHHAGWEGTREKGSIAIRAKSDIVTLVKLDAVGMTLNLTWLKNRRGPKYANVGFGVASVALDGWNDKVLTATGNEIAATSPQPAQAQNKHDQDLTLMIKVYAHDLGGNATSTQWRKTMEETYGWSRTKFHSKLDEVKREGYVVGGGEQGECYQVVPEALRKLGLSKTGPTQTGPGPSPLKGDGTSRTGFDKSQTVLNESQKPVGTGSNKSGNEQNSVEYDEHTAAEIQQAIVDERAKLNETARTKKNGWEDPKS